MKQMPEEERKDTHYNDEGFTRRMAIFRNLNESTVITNVQDFFKKYKSSYLALDCKVNEIELLSKIKNSLLEKVNFFKKF